MGTVVTYFKESWQELGKISWPNRKQTIRLTIGVIVFSILLAIFMGLVDLGFSALVKKLIIKG